MSVTHLPEAGLPLLCCHATKEIGDVCTQATSLFLPHFDIICDLLGTLRGSCLLWVMSTEISVDIAVDTRSIVG